MLADLRKENERLQRENRMLAKRRKDDEEDDGGEPRDDDDDDDDGDDDETPPEIRKMSQHVLKNLISYFEKSRILPSQSHVSQHASAAELPFGPDDTVCNDCERDFKNNAALEHHWRYYHKGEAGQV